jgi:exodeoxyribonuclease V alpha subunit
MIHGRKSGKTGNTSGDSDDYSVELEEVDGIGPGRRQKIKAAWVKQKAVRDIMIFLHSHGVGTSRAVRIYKAYGDKAIETVRANPYILAKDNPWHRV